MTYPLTAQLLIKKEILLTMPSHGFFSDETIESVWDELAESEDLQDSLCEFRGSGQEHVVEYFPLPMSRHYEVETHVRLMSGGQWVAWPYWYGGGKHSEPDGIDWLSDARLIAVTSEIEVKQMVRTFAVAP